MAPQLFRLKRIRKPEDAPIVGVGVTITADRNSHAGIVYRDIYDNVRLLHLAFHHDLRNGLFDVSYLCADPELEYEDAEAVAAHCRLIAEDMPLIRFALHYNPRATLVKRGNRMLLLREGKGLNCSTFVLTVFKDAGPLLINMQGWKKRDSDRPWHKTLIKILIGKGASRQYVKRVANDIGCARVRPEEVAGACLEPSLPADFEQCEPNGLVVIEALVNHTGRTLRPY
jgi:hypothetical protein